MTAEIRMKGLFYIIAGTTLFRLVYVNFVPLVPEEAYYWKYARHLALSYFDHPPLTAYIIAFFTWLGGDNVISVRLGAVILSAALMILIYAIARRLFANPRWALLAVLTANCTILFSLGSVVITPDTPLLFFWALAIYGLVRLRESDSRRWWYVTGLAVGLGLLSKYTAVLLIPGIFIYLLLSSEQRKWLVTLHPYAALTVALLVFSPVIMWNYRHDWASFAFQLPSRFSQGFRLRPGYAIQLFFTQLGLLTPFIFLLAVVGWLASGWRGILKSNGRYALLFWVACPVFVVFGLSSLTRLVKMNWLAPAYIPSVIAGIAWMNSSAGVWPERFRRWFKPGLILGLVFVVFAHLLPFISLSSMPSYDTWTGWKEIASRIMQIKEEMGPETFIFGDDYQIPSEITFYTPNHQVTYSGEIIGQEGLQYDYWTDTGDLVGRNAIFVRSKAPRIRDIDRLKTHFDSIQEDDRLEIVRHNHLVKVFYIYRCYGYKGAHADGTS
jgi:4-amino-4-deoxy-L-arabinose transferase-like glycosyltransferase